MIAASILALVAAGCDDGRAPASERATKLDSQGNTWYIWGEGRSPVDAVPYTCESIGREVAEVVLANKYGSEGTVRCK